MPRIKAYSVTSTLTEGPRAHTPIYDHEITLDQPVKAGGTDRGPTPIDAFLSTIGSCLGTIGRIVAKQKGITIGKMQFTVSGEVDLDVLLGRNEEDRAGFTSINVVADIESKKSIVDARFLRQYSTARRSPSRCLHSGGPAPN